MDTVLQVVSQDPSIFQTPLLIMAIAPVIGVVAAAVAYTLAPNPLKIGPIEI